MFVDAIANMYLTGRKLRIADCSSEGSRQNFTFSSISFLAQKVARTVFIVKRLRQASEKSGKV